MEGKLRALIVDDEESARQLLCKLLEETLFFNDIRLAASVASANNELINYEPDIIFLDIKMPGKDGFAFLQDLSVNPHKPGIVFVTAYDQFAIKAIKNQVFDYLLKPVNRKELKQCILRFLDSVQKSQEEDKLPKTGDQKEKIARIKINTRTGTVFINPATILYCKADGNYTIICTGEKQHLCSMNLGKLEEQLPKNGFIRVGRSYIVNYEYITVLDRKESVVTLNRDGESAKVKLPRQHLKDLDLI
jgi:two-component system, LytTR family, response regulator